MHDELRLRSDYFRLMNVNGAAHVYREAVCAGILDAIAAGPQTAGDVAAACDTDERGTALLLAVLESLGVVQPAGDAFALTPLAGMLMNSTYRDLGDTYWAHLPALLRTGEPLVAMDAVAQSEGFYQAQAAALAWMLGPAAQAAAGLLGFGGAIRDVSVLDVGAGSAVWSLSMAARDPGTTVTALDWPAVLGVARETAQRMGLEDRLTLLPGNYHVVDLPDAAFDVAVLGNVTHLETVDGNRALLQRVHATLKTGGRVAIFDVFPGLAEGDVERTLYALGLALRTEKGCVHTQETLEALLAETGFAEPRLVPLPVPPFAVGALLATAT